MAEEQAIPEEVMSEAGDVVVRIFSEENTALDEDDNAVYSAAKVQAVVARALLAAELRGREQQKEADASNSELIAAQAYQVIGNLLDRCGAYNSDEGIRALDYFAYGPVDENFLPWPKNGQSLDNPDYTPVQSES